MTRFGWNKQDLDVIIETTKPYWDRLRTDLIGPAHSGLSVADIEGLERSLRSLIAQGYSMTDIGAMFGVVRERVRQWLTRFGIAQLPERNMPRVWSPESECFVVVPHKVSQAQRRLANGLRRRRALEARQSARRAEQVGTLKELALDLGRTPTLDETAREFGVSVPSLAHLWRREGDTTTYREAFARLYAAAGLTPRAIGGHGHVDYNRAGMAYA